MQTDLQTFQLIKLSFLIPIETHVLIGECLIKIVYFYIFYIFYQIGNKVTLRQKHAWRRLFSDRHAV